MIIYFIVTGIIQFFVGLIVSAMLVSEGKSNYLTNGEKTALKISGLSLPLSPFAGIIFPLVIIGGLVFSAYRLALGIIKYGFSSEKS